jgi:hypothetical protein
MREGNGSTIALAAVSARDTLTTILRDGAQRMSAQAIDAEIAVEMLVRVLDGRESSIGELAYVAV